MKEKIEAILNLLQTATPSEQNEMIVEVVLQIIHERDAAAKKMTEELGQLKDCNHDLFCRIADHLPMGIMLKGDPSSEFKPNNLNNAGEKNRCCNLENC